MKTFKSLTEFKRVLAIGDTVDITLHGQKTRYSITKAQKNDFAVGYRRGDGSLGNSWTTYPLARHCIVENNVLMFLNPKKPNEKPYLSIVIV
jgi:hypothetical protein